ncbi:MAG TPA: hypothetical protein VJQ82_25910 [Terriglobales bacterium]|nr:hypothetical protein [Terriglobales bacterium]
MTVTLAPIPRYQWQGLSSDTKPTSNTVGVNDLFFESDTGNLFIYNGTSWNAYSGGGGGGLPTYPITPAETAAGVTPTSLNYPADTVVDIRRYGATAGGTVDCSAAFATAATVAAAGVGRQGSGTWVYVPPGDWKVITGFTLGERVGIIGSGIISRIQYAPTSNGTLITFQNGSSICDQNVIRDLRLWSADSTFVKVAINVIDVNFFLCSNVYVDGSVSRSGAFYWADTATGTSCGIKTNGRQALSFINVTLYADAGLIIDVNPNSTISLDHANFEGLGISSKVQNATQGCVTVNPGANLSNVSFTGDGAWVGGYHGFYWDDTIATSASFSITFENIRREQGTNTAGWDFYSHTNQRLQSLDFRGCYFSSQDGGCVSLRNTGTVHLNSCNLNAASGRPQIDTDNTVFGLQLSANNSGTIGTNGITGMNLVRSSGFEPAGAIHPSDAMYVSTGLNANVDQVFPVGTRGTAVSVTSGTIVLLRLRNCSGQAIINTNTYATWSGIFQGNGNGVTQMGTCNSSGGVAWSTTKNNANTYNVFFDASGASGQGYYFQNNDASTVRICCLFLGSTFASGF